MSDLRPGLRDQLITEALESALTEIDSDLIARAELDDADAADRLTRHLATVAQRVFDRLRDREVSSTQQAEMVNAIIDRLAAQADVGVDRLRVPPELLGGIKHPPRGLALAHLPDQPVIPLITSDLLVNSHNEPALGQQLRSELPSVRDVDLLVSFVKKSGVRTLLEDLNQVVDRGGSLRVITTTYMSATDPEALEALVAAGGRVRVDYDAERARLHAKAWVLHRPGGLTTAFLGSSNVSHAALHQGLEWNLRLSEVEAPHLVSKMRATFESYWEDSRFESFDPATDGERLRASLLEQKRSKRRGLGGGYAAFEVTPKPHQKRMLEQIHVQRSRHDRHRNLLVAATGTGKTVMAALDYRRLCEQHGQRLSLLFVAHRRRILDQSRSTYATIMRDPDFGEILGDGQRPLSDAQVFAMVQSLSNEAVERLSPDAYDVVVIDEVHHAAAPSYRSLLEHLHPRELLGLTATPERMDGVDITRWFGRRTAVELQLWEAIEDGHLAPFQYFGIHDPVDLSDLEWRQGGYRTEDLERKYVVTGDDMRVRRILDGMRRVLIDPNEMRALGFCVSVAHARYMAAAFTSRGVPSEVVSGETATEQRERALGRLQQGDLRCVFSVDVLGEGVDVPSVDTVLLLRPTESAAVLTQQIGRGLRTHEGKTTLTVVDLIGQQHRRFRFDTKLRALIDPRNGRLVDQAEQGFPYLPAGCEIKLDRMSRNVILKSLKDATSARSWTTLVEDLRRLGDVDFETFLAETERTLADVYHDAQRTWTRLRRDAGLLAPSGNDHERVLLRSMHRLQHIDDPERVATYREVLSRDGSPKDGLSPREYRLLTMLLVGIFGRRHGFPSFAAAIDAVWACTAAREELAQLFELLGRESEAAPGPLGILGHVPLAVHARYTRDEALLALGDGSFEKPPTSREGVRWLKDLRTDLMFVTLRKSERRYSPSTRYRDYALSPTLLHWESQSTTAADSPTGRRYRAQATDDTTALFFVREAPTVANGSGAPFVLLGPATFVESRGEKPMQVTWRLRDPMPESLLEVARVVAA